ncbi:MAG TPA: ABC transporter permease [Rhizobacter sp.]|nr:ABC transporter permease [Rhizobacter sp.]
MTAGVVFRKELVDALRDRRTLLVVLLSAVLLGPMVLIALSGLLASFEARAERRVVVAVGMEHAPALKNFLERQSFSIKTAPADYEALLRRSRLGDAVLVVPERFEAELLAGEQPVVEVVSDSGNRQSQASAGRLVQLVQAYGRERGQVSLLMRGVSPELLSPLQVEERDLASTQTRAAQLTGMLPFFVIMAVLYGALNAALDTTAGERERASLEPLLMTPAARSALVLGKWGAVAVLAMLIAVLSCLSFLPAQWLLRSETLQAMFQFGLREAVKFLVVLLPFAAALSALLMAVAIRCKSFKEAQASSTVVILAVSLLPLVTIFNQSGEARWHLWVPALAQYTLMMRTLKGEGFGAEQVLVPLFVCALLTVIGVAFVARRLRSAAVR